MTFQGLGEAGTLLVPSNGTSVYTTKSFAGFVALGSSGNAVSGTLRLLDHPIDDLNNEFPSAKDASVSRELSLTAGSGGAWSSSGAVLTPRTISVQPLASIPRLWRFRNLYRFAGAFLDYEIQIDLTSAGDLTGFDTNDCQFTGQLTQTQTESTYAVRISAWNCGATMFYIENGDYFGRAYATPAPDQRLIVVAVNEPRRIGLSLYLAPR